MVISADNVLEPSRAVEPAAPRQGWLRRDGKAMLPAAAITILLELGVFFLARGLGRSVNEAVVVFLATASLWLALAPGALAASGRGILSPLLRGGIVADATGLCLLVLWLATPCVSFWGAVQIYCIAWSMALVGIAAVWIACTPVGRLIAAVTTAALLCLTLTSLLWLGAWIGRSPGAWDASLATWAVGINPFCAMTGTVAQEVRFVWHEWGRMYAWTPVGEYAMPSPTSWYETCFLYLCLAGGFACVALLRDGIKRFRDML
jgi:hypothetical protein